MTEVPYRHQVLAIAAGSVFITIDVSDYSNGGDAARPISSLLDSITIPKAKKPEANARDLDVIRGIRTKPWDEVNPIKLPEYAVRDVARLRDRGFKPPVLAVTGLGELEITASASGKNVVIGTNSGYANSTDFGTTFTAGAGTTPFAGITTRGDPSTGLGVTGAFYLSYLGNPAGGGAGANSLQRVHRARDRLGLTAGRHGTIAATRGSARTLSRRRPIASPIRSTSRRTRVMQAAVASVRHVPNQIRCTPSGASSPPPRPRLAPRRPVTVFGRRTPAVAMVSRASCSKNGGRAWIVAPRGLDGSDIRLLQDHGGT